MKVEELMLTDKGWLVCREDVRIGEKRVSPLAVCLTLPKHSAVVASRDKCGLCIAGVCPSKSAISCREQGICRLCQHLHFREIHLEIHRGVRARCPSHLD